MIICGTEEADVKFKIKVRNQQAIKMIIIWRKAKYTLSHKLAGSKCRVDPVHRHSVPPLPDEAVNVAINLSVIKHMSLPSNSDRA